MKSYLIIIVVIIVFLLSNKKPDYEKQFSNYISKLKKDGVNSQLLRRIEQIYRLETGNFKANIFLHTKGAGALANGTYPYGFKGLTKVKTNGKYSSPNGFKYVKFSSLSDGIYFLALYLLQGDLDKRTSNWGGGGNYLTSVKKIKTKYT